MPQHWNGLLEVISELLLFKNKLRNHSPYVEVDGLLAAQEELRARILRVISRTI